MYRIRNIETKNFVSKNINVVEAKKLLSSLNQREERFEAVDMDEILDSISREIRPMTEPERAAIIWMQNISFNPNATHSDFAYKMIKRLEARDYKINDREAAYLWWIVWHYRRQIDSKSVIENAKRLRKY